MHTVYSSELSGINNIINLNPAKQNLQATLGVKEKTFSEKVKYILGQCCPCFSQFTTIANESASSTLTNLQYAILDNVYELQALSSEKLRKFIQVSRKIITESGDLPEAKTVSSSLDFLEKPRVPSADLEQLLVSPTNFRTPSIFGSSTPDAFDSESDEFIVAEQ